MRRSPSEQFRFSMLEKLGISVPIGTILTFYKDSTITCTVAGDRDITFRSRRMSLSRSARIILDKMGYSRTTAQGPACWCLHGELLDDLRDNHPLCLKVAERMRVQDAMPDATSQEAETKEHFRFSMLDIPVPTGTILTFHKDSAITCTVASDRDITFRGERMSLSKSARIVLNEMGYMATEARGPRHWCLHDELLDDLRTKAEKRQGRRGKPVLAICYDFDGTLMPGNMQEHSFIPSIGMTPNVFWNKVRRYARKRDMDEILAYMHLMIEEAKAKKLSLSRAAIKKHGANLQLFPGVRKWFERIDKYGQKHGVDIEHYVISSGIDDMIEGSPIGKHFKHIFASGFAYETDTDASCFVARSVNYTSKTQYLFRISKGIFNSWDNKVNERMDESELRIPFTRMIYIGDGLTDVPSMKMVNYQGGYTIAVYPGEGANMTAEEYEKERQKVERLHTDNRTQFTAEADYSENKRLHEIVTSLIDRISNELKFRMNLEATSRS